MSKEMSEYQVKCMMTMSTCRFTYLQRREWTIWAAKFRRCSVCSAPPFKPCINMAKFKQRRQQIVPTRNPHESRVDWKRMYEGLKMRGYCE